MPKPLATAILFLGVGAVAVITAKLLVKHL